MAFAGITANNRFCKYSSKALSGIVVSFHHIIINAGINKSEQQ
jgi:hypothetical protein